MQTISPLFLCAMVLHWSQWFMSFTIIEMQPKVFARIRGFLAGQPVFEEEIVEADDAIDEMATRHGQKFLTGEITMIEIEFLEDLNDPDRFLRFGVDPAGMFMPMKLIL